MTDLLEPSVAFALGGLAGNNAHGAGFLHAALKAGVRPRMISCTSGQTRNVYHYLKILGGEPGDLRQLFKDEVDAMSVCGIKVADMIRLGFTGLPGVFRPAWCGFFFDWLENAAATLHRACRAYFNVVPWVEAMRTFPCRYFEPCGQEEFQQEASKLFNSSEMGIVFNSFNPVAGVENVYLNDAARDLLHSRGKRNPQSYADGQPSHYRKRTTYADITPAAIRDALWLYNYGCDPEDRPRAPGLFFDGAYFRQIILNELTPVDRIYVARPINHRWFGPLPTDYADLEDLKTKLTFNGSYDGERHQILLINKLVNDRSLKRPLAEGDGDGQAERYYHQIELVEVEIQQPRGFLDYVFEDMDVFDDACRLALAAFQKHEHKPASPPEPPAGRSHRPHVSLEAVH